ncbi:hypothetical protein ERO13_A09G030200v2 [Gossypium hirsutum]|uniref:E3 ubiquitin-protein ligase RGLG2 isoform X2 n=1 Tax=Gossypium hirsutum TaxID=3635 RepID=A0ABM2YSG1_GOSHI|nr:E3 ubiquitin-protein ligase RGLG2 isoform X2 [Gossypium hirsutum]KAG4182213.1 hypothetical protein ERO13_A09G030200v2 [Gossypium hirsutum]KAG4182214.1 hypothetical protein ERO13_A09G030200v2 [Gossypium hirsutum]
MGGSSSKDVNWRQNSSYRTSSASWDSHTGNPQYGQESPSYMSQYSSASLQYYPPSQPELQYYPPPQNRGSDKRTLDRRYSRIADNYNSLDQVTEALANAGLESSNLIVGIDFTKSNEWTGKRSFNRKSLHHIGNSLNPYEQAISIIGKTLAAFDEDNLIPCFGFGDASTHDQDVFSFYPDDRFCNGFEEVLSRYREIVPHLRLAGPTSFAPIIEMAMTIVEQSGGQYHVLVIIADGQVTRSIDTQHGRLSPQEQKTVDAIVQASKLPLSIILVGVGDGPWDMMKEFDDNIPARAFDNFQFVNSTEIMSKNTSPSRKETEFALAALMEIPSQYKATIELNILGEMFPREFHYLLLHTAHHLLTDPNHPILLVSNMVQHLSAAQNLLILPVSHQVSLLIWKTVIPSAQLPQLQVLIMITSFVPFALVTRKTWHSVVDIRPVKNVRKTSKRVRYAEVRSKPK